MSDIKSLHEIDEVALDIYRLIAVSDGEVTPAIELALSVNELEKAHKVDAYGCIMDRLESEAELWKRRADECKRKQQTIENANKKLKENMKYSMVRMGTKRVEGNYHGFTLSGSQPSLVIDDEKKIPESYFVETVVRDLNKTALKETLKEGVSVDGARLESGFTLRRSLSKKELGNDKKD